jgi:NADH-quinone oxidoreductase subunit L
MAMPLMLLAAGSIVAGYLGVPHALGGSNRLEQFLAPSFALETVESHPTAQSPRGGDPGVAGEHAVGAGAELALMGVSTLVALVGIGLAVHYFLRRRSAAAALAARFTGFYRILLNKYYVDEIYDETIVQPIVRTSTRGLWKRVDVGVIDGVVNGVGRGVAETGYLLRLFQTGSVRAYAASLFLGVLVVLSYYLWR